MYSLSQYPKLTWNIFVEILIALLATIAVTGIYILTGFAFIYRLLIVQLAHLWDKNISQNVTGLSAMFHRDFDTCHVKPLSSIVTCLRIKGPQLSQSAFMATFLHRVVLKRDKSNELVYPELQQHYKQFLGYSFLKWDLNFDISKHFTVYPDKYINRQKLPEIWEELMVKPYRQNQSPWEVVIVDKYIKDDEEIDMKTSPDWICFLRVHHGIADGFCVEKILCTLFETSYFPNFHIKKISKLQRFLGTIKSFIVGPYEVVNRVIRYGEDFHTFHIPAHEHSKQYFVFESPLIPVTTVKKLKEHFNVAFTAVLIEMICGGLRNFLIKNSKPIPDLISVGIPIPAGERSMDKLGNDFFLAPVDLPVQSESQMQRLKIVDQGLKNLSRSSFMQTLDFIIGRISLFPSRILRAVTRKSVVGVAYSTIPGPNMPICGLNGCEMIEANFTHGMASDSLGLCFSSITFNGNLRITLFVEKNLVESRDQAGEILNCVMDEYKELLLSSNCLNYN